MINRLIQTRIEEWLGTQNIIIIYGARQVGKTTLAKKIIEKYSNNSLYLSCESNRVKTLLETKDVENIISFFDNKEYIVLDEAQKIKDIGTTLKLIYDFYPKINIIATGSSSFELSNSINEPLTGRNAKFYLYPISLKELVNQTSINQVDESLEKRIRFGLYPEILDYTDQKASQKLDFIAGDYLYRDVLTFESLKKSDLLVKLLKALAFQIGNEVTYRELAKLLDTTHVTIAKYIDLLEQSFIIYKLSSFSRNIRKELKNGFKIYFWDIGIRNGLIENFNHIESRNDIGAIWENFCITERIKKNQAEGIRSNLYFWRSTENLKEIDLIEERNGKLYTFEIKWSLKASQNARLPLSFLESYGMGENEGNVEFQTINRSNWWKYLV
jgi:uncharacterized protein